MRCGAGRRPRCRDDPQAFETPHIVAPPADRKTRASPARDAPRRRPLSWTTSTASPATPIIADLKPSALQRDDVSTPGGIPAIMRALLDASRSTATASIDRKDHPREPGQRRLDDGQDVIVPSPGVRAQRRASRPQRHPVPRRLRHQDRRRQRLRTRGRPGCAQRRALTGRGAAGKMSRGHRHNPLRRPGAAPAARDARGTAAIVGQGWYRRVKW